MPPSSSLLTVTYASNSSSVCTVSGSSITFHSGGVCSITASQAGNTNFAGDARDAHLQRHARYQYDHLPDAAEHAVHQLRRRRSPPRPAPASPSAMRQTARASCTVSGARRPRRRRYLFHHGLAGRQCQLCDSYAGDKDLHRRPWNQYDHLPGLADTPFTSPPPALTALCQFRPRHHLCVKHDRHLHGV